MRNATDVHPLVIQLDQLRRDQGLSLRDLAARTTLTDSDAYRVGWKDAATAVARVAEKIALVAADATAADAGASEVNGS